jgi:hypothetical protein
VLTVLLSQTQMIRRFVTSNTMVSASLPSLVPVFAGKGGAWSPWTLSVGFLLLLVALVVSSVLALAKKRRPPKERASPSRQLNVRAMRVLGGTLGEPPVRNPGTAQGTGGAPEVGSAAPAQPGGEDYLLIRTTGIAAAFHGPGKPPPLQLEETVSSELRPGDLFLVQAGQAVPRNGTVVEGAALIDESAVTGMATPVFYESGGQPSDVPGGTLVLSGRVIIRVTA